MEEAPTGLCDLCLKTGCSPSSDACPRQTWWPLKSWLIRWVGFKVSSVGNLGQHSSSSPTSAAGACPSSPTTARCTINVSMAISKAVHLPYLMLPRPGMKLHSANVTMAEDMPAYERYYIRPEAFFYWFTSALIWISVTQEHEQLSLHLAKWCFW